MKGKLYLASLLLLTAALVLAPVPAKAAMWVGVEIGPNWMGSNTVQLPESAFPPPVKLKQL